MAATLVLAPSLPASAAGPQNSGTFAGYIATPATTGGEARVSFVVPTLSCPTSSVDTGTAAGAFLAVHNGNFAGAAIDLRCAADGTASYTASGTFNGGITPLAITVKSGDHVTTQITVNSSSATATVLDSSTHMSASATGPGFTPAIAPIGMDDDLNGGIEIGVPPFGHIDFTAALVNGKPLGSFNPARYRRTSGTTVQIGTSQLTTPRSFTTTFRHS